MSQYSLKLNSPCSDPFTWVVFVVDVVGVEGLERVGSEAVGVDML